MKIRPQCASLLNRQVPPDPEKLWLEVGTPLGGQSQYMIERVYQNFLPFQLHKFASFGICIILKGCPPLTFINLHGFSGVATSFFHQPKHVVFTAKISLKRFLCNSSITDFKICPLSGTNQSNMFYPISQLFKSKRRGLQLQYGCLYLKTKMGLAGLMFEPHPPNFENLYNF